MGIEMGLTKSSTGLGAAERRNKRQGERAADKIIALAGNPNVGKSTLFNALTGMNQHTGNWTGKTVVNARGYCRSGGRLYEMVDLPGTYSLSARSAEEETARDFICSGEADAVVVVCDASCLQRNLNLVLQITEVAAHVLVCVNLLDEAERKHIKIDFKELSKQLGVPVVGTVARKKKSLDGFLRELDALTAGQEKKESAAKERGGVSEAGAATERTSGTVKAAAASVPEAFLFAEEETRQEEEDKRAAERMKTAERIFKAAVTAETEGYQKRDRQIDRILTGKWTGYPFMLLLLAAVFWLTIEGANYPSALLARLLFFIQNRLTELFAFFGAPEWLHGAVVLGMYRVLAWVVSVMLPPMAIFFPLFTLLEDLGYLPRAAYNLDRPFKRCSACGKQALTMCMGFGCNAAGVVGCRIIDSKRERLIAVLTNSFVPCNGRFPTLLAVISMFFAAGTGFFGSVSAALLLTAVIVAGVLMTFFASWLLSKTVLKGMSSAFTLELPPYRKPQAGKILVRSVCDRTLFVLGRAAVSAAPAGLLIWFLANSKPGGISLLSRLAGALDPFAAFLGMDGVILLAFLLGIPANEIVLPIIIMAYTAQGSLSELTDLQALKALLAGNGWTWKTAFCVTVFSLFHWPCATTLLTIKKETGSLGWTLLAFLLPTLIGGGICFLFAAAPFF